MKQLELELKKRLLIWEIESESQLEAIQSFQNLGHFTRYKDNCNLKLICRGSELTEDIAKELVKNEISDYLVEWAYDYKNEEQLNLDTFSCLESFISAIEAQGYHWGENPIDFDDDENDFNKRHEMRVNWEKAESKTFNPSKTLIFEIL